MLIVRGFLLAAALLVGGYACANERGDERTIAQSRQKTEEEQPAPMLDTSSLEKTIREAVKEASEKPDPNANERLEADRKLAEYARQLAVYTEQLADYTSKVSIFTLLLFGATLILGGVGVWQGIQLKRSVDLARKAFVSTHRPRLRVRRWVSRDGEEITQPRVEIANVGDSDAHIIDSHVQIINSDDELTALRKFDDSVPNNPIPMRKIASGESVGLGELEFTERTQHDKVLEESGGIGAFLYAIGWVRYSDGNGTMRRTAFCRRRDPETGFFHTPGDVNWDYEYED